MSDLTDALDKVAVYHRWGGGYYCDCGALMNSPQGYAAHLIEALAPVVESRIARRADSAFLAGVHHGRSTSP